MIHPHTEVRWIDDEIGRGVVATRFIPRGTVTWVRDRLDREFTPYEVESFDAAHREIVERYSYRNAVGNYFFCWDHARFMNHSFHPNCLPTPLGFEVAILDIADGEELTNDYGALNILEPFTPRPEAGSVRSQVRPDDLLRYADAWDSLIAAALKQFFTVDQPLVGWLEKDVLLELKAETKGERSRRSIAELYFHYGGEIAAEDGN